MQKMISNIVFTKNRPLQLEAYLESLYRYFPRELIQTYIIYKVELFREEYEQLFRKFSNCVVVREKDFHSDFMQVLDKVKTKYILFGIDDVVYFDCVDFEVIDEAFAKYTGDIFGFTLRFGGETIKNGSDPVSETFVTGQTVYGLDWTQGRTPTTRYPFELCATIYPTALAKRVIGDAMNDNPLIKRLFVPSSVLIKALGKIISTRSVLKSFGYFYSPNTLESWNCRWCQKNASRLPGLLYFQKLCASAIQVNMVNVTTRRSFDGSAENTVEELAKKYQQGHRLDIDYVSQNKPAMTHCGPEHFRLK